MGADGDAELRERLLGEGSGEVHLELGDRVAHLALDRPEAANALSGRMMALLAERVDALEAQCARDDCGLVGLILRGEGGRAFCAGSDLGLVRAYLDADGFAGVMCAFMQRLTDRIARLPLLSVAAIDGVAIGGGAELATACDVRVLSRGGQIRFIQARLGLSPGWGGGVRLVRRVGPAVALRVLGRAEALDAETALGLGVVDALCEPGQAPAAAERLIAESCPNAPRAQRAAKAVVAAASAIPAAAYDEERAIFARLWGGPEQRAALSRR